MENSCDLGGASASSKIYLCYDACNGSCIRYGHPLHFLRIELLFFFWCRTRSAQTILYADRHKETCHHGKTDNRNKLLRLKKSGLKKEVLNICRSFASPGLQKYSTG